MLKGTYWTEATLNSKKIKPVTLSTIELHWSVGIGHHVEYEFFIKCVATLSKHFQSISYTLTNTAPEALFFILVDYTYSFIIPLLWFMIKLRMQQVFFH